MILHIISTVNFFRVPDASTIFKYKGDKTLEEIRLENCKQTTICSCEKTKSYCGVEGINKCFPSENGKDHTNIEQGTLHNKRYFIYVYIYIYDLASIVERGAFACYFEVYKCSYWLK